MSRRYQNKGGQLSEQGNGCQRFAMEVDLRWNSDVISVLLQTVNAQENVESRLQRLKEVTPVVEQHNEGLEDNKENASIKLSADAVTHSEVSVFKDHICVTTCHCPLSASTTSVT